MKFYEAAGSRSAMGATLNRGPCFYCSDREKRFMTSSDPIVGVLT
jgi:hypothetical protein